MDPSNNIYPHNPAYVCKCHQDENGKYQKPVLDICKYPDEFALYGAVYFLQVKRVEELLQNYDCNKLLEQKYHTENILEYICGHHGMIVGNRNTVLYKNKRDEKQEVIDIVKLLLDKEPQLITDKCYSGCKYYKNDKMLSLLFEYDISENLDNKCCYICHLTRMEETMLYDICICKMPIHHQCFIKLFNKTKHCNTCKSDFIINEKRYKNTMFGSQFDDRIFSPFDDYYPLPAFPDKYIKVDTLENKITFAIMYLQYSRLKSLLDTITGEQFKKYIREYNDTGICIFERYNEVNIKLGKNPCNNYHKSINNYASSQIESLLNHKLDDN